MKTSELTHKELWEAQLQEYPDSVKLGKRDLLNLIHRDSRAIAFCYIRHPNGIFYACHRNSLGAYRSVGCRFGVEPEDYYSGFQSASVTIIQEA